MLEATSCVSACGEVTVCELGVRACFFVLSLRSEASRFASLNMNPVIVMGNGSRSSRKADRNHLPKPRVQKFHGWSVHQSRAGDMRQGPQDYISFPPALSFLPLDRVAMSTLPLSSSSRVRPAYSLKPTTQHALLAWIVASPLPLPSPIRLPFSSVSPSLPPLMGVVSGRYAFNAWRGGRSGTDRCREEE